MRSRARHRRHQPRELRVPEQHHRAIGLRQRREQVLADERQERALVEHHRADSLEMIEDARTLDRPEHRAAFGGRVRRDAQQDARFRLGRGFGARRGGCRGGARGVVEFQQDRSEPDRVAGDQRHARRDPAAVDERPVRGIEILDAPLVVLARDDGVMARDARVGERQVGGRSTADDDDRLIEAVLGPLRGPAANGQCGHALCARRPSRAEPRRAVGSRCDVHQRLPRAAAPGRPDEAAVADGAHGIRKTNCTLPTSIVSPSVSDFSVTRWPLTNVPFCDPRSLSE